MEIEFGDRVVHWENHCSGTDPFTTAETTARENYYGVAGYPTVFIDGILKFEGAAPCDQQTVTYRNAINDRLAATEGSSPIVINSSMSIAGGVASMSATFKLVDPVQLSNLRGTLLLYEDDLTWCCGYGGVDHWDRVTRKIYDQNITLSAIGDEATISVNVPIGAWVPANLTGVAYVQQTTTKEIIQAQKIGAGAAPDFSSYYTQKVRSVPDGNGMAVFEGQIWNLQTTNQTFTLEPGTAFGDWTTDFIVCGDPNPHTTPTQVTLAPDQICNFQVRVHTNSALEARNGSFKITSESSLREQTNSLRVFNGSYSVYLINDNSNNQHYLVFTQPLDQLGYLYDRWDINYGHGGSAPAWGNVMGYDIMIWENGLRTSSMPNAAEQALMMRFMDAGGSLFYTSQAFLNSLNNTPNTFTQNYLGISTWTVDTAYLTLTGVAGDPIGNGLSLPLDFDFPSLNKGDHVVPNTAVTGLIGDGTSNALVHNVLRGAKSVFMPACFNAVSGTDPDPNNQKFLLGRIMQWLEPEVPADAPDASLFLASRIGGVRPNPFNPRTEIAFELSPVGASDAVRLDIFDLGGRRIANLLEGQLAPGRHSRTWTGTTDGGQAVESGVYFVRLTTVEGVRSEKLVLMK